MIILLVIYKRENIEKNQEEILLYEICTYKVLSVLKINRGRGCPVGRALSSGRDVSSSRLTCETPPCMLMAPGACKIGSKYNVLQVPIQIIPLEYQSWGAIPSVADQNCNGMSSDHS